MYISFSSKFIYLPPPKTGSTGLIDILAKKYNTFVIGTKHDIFMPEALRNFFVFATVRNPFTIMISRYNHARRDNTHPAHESVRKLNFDQFVRWCVGELFIQELKDIKYLPLYKWLKQHEDYKPPKGCIKVRLDAVLKLESLEPDFNSLLPFVTDTVEIPKSNIGRNHSAFSSGELEWDEGVYTRETIELVKDWAKSDFDIFHYSYDPPEEIIINY